MRLGWKVFLPISLFMVVATAGLPQDNGVCGCPLSAKPQSRCCWQDFVSAFFLSMRQSSRRRRTINYPHEKGPTSPRFRGEHALRRYRTARNAALPASCAKRSARRRRSPSKPDRVAMTARAAPCATTSTW